MKKPLSIEAKIKAIKKSKRIDDLRLEIMPPTDEREYFFVSYSHKDYKEVYTDILRLQEKGIPVWYDNGRLPAGEEWFKVVAQKIANYSCKGIIFYISENTVKHPEQVERELKIVLNSKKPFLSINLPVQGIENFKGKFFSAKKLMDIYGKPESILSEIFTDGRIYLKYSDDPLDKSYELNKIRDKSSAIVYEKDGKTAKVKATRDPYITRAVVTELIENNYNSYAVDEIGCCAFTNCNSLQSVVLGEDMERIGDCAFYGCENLEELVIQNAHIYEIGWRAFSGCKSLTNIDLSNTRDMSKQRRIYVVKDLPFGERPQKKSLTIGSHAFSDSGLESITFPEDTEIYIRGRAFSHSNLKRITLSAFMECDNCAFAGCKSLESVKFEEGITEIKARQFEGCDNIKSISIPSTLVKIDRDFMGKDEPFSFERVEVAEGNPVYRAENNCLIEREGERLISWHKGAEIPPSVKIIDRSIFEFKTELNNLIIPEGVEIIEEGNFDCLYSGCITLPKSLKNIKFLGEAANRNIGRDSGSSYTKSASGKYLVWGKTQLYSEITSEKFDKVDSKLKFIYKGTVAQMAELVRKEELKKGAHFSIECSDGMFEYTHEE